MNKKQKPEVIRAARSLITIAERVPFYGKFAMVCYQQGITKRAAITEALRAWIDKETKGKVKV